MNAKKARTTVTKTPSVLIRKDHSNVAVILNIEATEKIVTVNTQNNLIFSNSAMINIDICLGILITKETVTKP